MAIDRQKHLRFSSDQKLLLDTLRQYLHASSESEAAGRAMEYLAALLLAAYLHTGTHPHRCYVLLGVLNAATDGYDTPTYQVDESNRLLRWHAPSQTYIPVPPVLTQWILVE